MNAEVELMNKALTAKEEIPKGFKMEALGERNKDFQMALGSIPMTKRYYKKMIRGYRKLIRDFNGIT